MSARQRQRGWQRWRRGQHDEAKCAVGTARSVLPASMGIKGDAELSDGPLDRLRLVVWCVSPVRVKIIGHNNVI